MIGSLISTLIMLGLMVVILWRIDVSIKRKSECMLADGALNENSRASTGFIIWGILNCLLFLITGLFGVIYTIKSRKAGTNYKQAYYYGVAKKWNVIGSVWGALVLISTIAPYL